MVSCSASRSQIHISTPCNLPVSTTLCAQAGAAYLQHYLVHYLFTLLPCYHVLPKAADKAAVPK